MILLKLNYHIKIKLPLDLYDGVDLESRIKCRGFIGKAALADPMAFSEMETNGDSRIVWIFPDVGKEISSGRMYPYKGQRQTACFDRTDPKKLPAVCYYASRTGCRWEVWYTALQAQAKPIMKAAVKPSTNMPSRLRKRTHWQKGISRAASAEGDKMEIRNNDFKLQLKEEP